MGALSGRAAQQRKTIERLCKAITEDHKQRVEGIHAEDATAEDLKFRSCT